MRKFGEAVWSESNMSYSSSYSQTEPDSGPGSGGYVPLNNEQFLPVNIVDNETQGRTRTR